MVSFWFSSPIVPLTLAIYNLTTLLLASSYPNKTPAFAQFDQQGYRKKHCNSLQCYNVSVCVPCQWFKSVLQLMFAAVVLALTASISISCICGLFGFDPVHSELEEVIRRKEITWLFFCDFKVISIKRLIQ